MKDLNIAVLRHVPHVILAIHNETDLYLTSGTCMAYGHMADSAGAGCTGPILTGQPSQSSSGREPVIVSISNVPGVAISASGGLAFMSKYLVHWEDLWPSDSFHKRVLEAERA